MTSGEWGFPLIKMRRTPDSPDVALEVALSTEIKDGAHMHGFLFLWGGYILMKRGLGYRVAARCAATCLRAEIAGTSGCEKVGA